MLKSIIGKKKKHNRLIPMCIGHCVLVVCVSGVCIGHCVLVVCVSGVCIVGECWWCVVGCVLLVSVGGVWLWGVCIGSE